MNELKDMGYAPYPYGEHDCAKALLRKKVIAFIDNDNVFFYSRHKGFRGFLGTLQAKLDCLRLKRRLGK